MKVSNSVKALISLAFLAAVAAAAGAHIQHCDGSDDKQYKGDGSCVKWDSKSSFEVAKVGKKCTGKFLAAFLVVLMGVQC